MDSVRYNRQSSNLESESAHLNVADLACRLRLPSEETFVGFQHRAKEKERVQKLSSLVRSLSVNSKKPPRHKVPRNKRARIFGHTLARAAINPNGGKLDRGWWPASRSIPQTASSTRIFVWNASLMAAPSFCRCCRCCRRATCYSVVLPPPLLLYLSIVVVMKSASRATPENHL